MITACDHDHDHDHHDDDDYYYYYHYHPFIIIHILSIYYPWWWMWISWRQYWDSHPLASVEHVPRTLCQAPVRLPIGQWSPVTSCANLSGELSQDCPIIHMYIHIHVYIYIVYHSMVNLSQTDHHHGRLNHIYIYTLFLYIHVCSYHIYPGLVLFYRRHVRKKKTPDSSWQWRLDAFSGPPLRTLKSWQLWPARTPDKRVLTI